MATRALSGLCILFILLTASHVLPSTKAARILKENKAVGIDGEDRSLPYSYPPSPRSGIHSQPGQPYTQPCPSPYYPCPPEPPPPESPEPLP